MPEVGTTSPATASRHVVFPHPLGPINAQNSPLGIVREMSSRTGAASYRCDTRSKTTAGSAACIAVPGARSARRGVLGRHDVLEARPPVDQPQAFHERDRVVDVAWRDRRTEGRQVVVDQPGYE